MAQPELSRSRSPEPAAISRAETRLAIRRLTLRAQALLYLAALGLAELLVALWEPRAGMLLHGAILMALLVHATLYARGIWKKFFLALATAPLIRLLSLTMPLPEFPFVYWYFIVGTPLFITAFLVMRYTRLSRQMVGLTMHKPLTQILVGLTGLFFGWVEYLILRPDPLAEELHWRFFWLPALILFVFTGFLEELIFRGVMQYTAIRSLGRSGLWYVGAVFAVLHFGYRSFIDVIFVFAVAIFFAYAVQRTGSILGVTISHGLTNIGLFLIFPFLLARPVQQIPVPQDIFSSAPIISATPIIIPTRTPTPTHTPTITSTPVTPTTTVTITGTSAPSEPPSPTFTLFPSATICSRPAGWILYSVQFGDTWSSISARYGLSTLQLQLANCQDPTGVLSVGQQIYIPYLFYFPTSPPPSTLTPSPTRSNTLVPSPTTTVDTSTSIPPTTIFDTPTPAPPEPTVTIAQPTATQAPPTATREVTTLPPPNTTMTPLGGSSPTLNVTTVLPSTLPTHAPTPP